MPITTRPQTPLRARGAPPGHQRRSQIPSVPGADRRELDLLSEVRGPLGPILWRLLSDTVLWSAADPSVRGELFSNFSPRSWNLSGPLAGPAELEGALRILAELPVYPATDSAAVASACAMVAAWLEVHGRKGAALQFAEAGARAHPNDPLRCYVAGRLCRRAGECERAKRWLARAIRLARRANDDIAFAHAHRGYGFVLADMGQFEKAEPHFWKCVRAAKRKGRRSLAGSGYHDLFMVAVHLERWDDALEYSQKAVALYKVGHPRFPLLAHDIAFFWCRRGFYSSGLPVFEKILPFVERQRERILVLASLARSAAVVRDNIRFQRAASAVLALAESDAEMSASSLYHLAEGARCFHDWDRAEELARQALATARRRGNGTVVHLAEQLLNGLHSRQPGDIDTVPAEGSVVDATRELLLKKLVRQPLADDGKFPLLPEQYPTE